MSDLVGAAQDFQIVVDWLYSSQAPFLPDDNWKTLRQSWLNSLQNLQNPFTPEVIEQIPRITLQTGDVQITLDWSVAADLDLSITDPNGDRIYYDNKIIPSEGQLEADIVCDNLLPNPPQAENIFWPTDVAPAGNYTIGVDLSSRCETSTDDNGTSEDDTADATNMPINFSVNVLNQGQLQTFTGTVSEENPSVEFEFSVPPNR
ncbi:MAG: hypothetical protein AAF921_18570 [Cyanobacteria bacterium P01_D01_bin.44]